MHELAFQIKKVVSIGDNSVILFQKKRSFRVARI